MTISKRKFVLWAFALVPMTYLLYTHISRAEKHLVLEEILNDTGLGSVKVCSISNKIDVSEANLADFSKFDRPSVYLQKLFQSASLDKELLSSTVLVENCDQEHNFIYKVSLPILSSGGNLALIKITEDCNCILGGYGGEFVFRKINGKWKKINSFNNWIS